MNEWLKINLEVSHYFYIQTPLGKGLESTGGHIDRLTAIYVESNIVNHDCLVYIIQEKTISQWYV